MPPPAPTPALFEALKAEPSSAPRVDSTLALRRIGMITTSRADSGIYEPLIRALDEKGRFQIVVYAGGTHHDPSFGSTAETLPRSPRIEVRRVHHVQPGDSPRAVASTAGRAMLELAGSLGDARLDLVFVLGDRTEMVAAALAALIHHIPIAHLHGGDVTEGAYDDACRHAISKLAHLHFPALPAHAARLAAMGEEAWRIHVVGALALDTLRAFQPLNVQQTSDRLGLDFSRPAIVALFHPETLADEPPQEQVDRFLAALEPFEEGVLVLGSNADAGHLAFRDALRRFAEGRPNRVLRSSLTQADYWSALAHARALVGNSSSGLLEAPSLKTPVVNIGRRQAGRIRAANVIDVPLSANAIRSGLKRALSDAFRAGLAHTSNPYGDGRAAERILAALAELPDRPTLLRKRWPSGPLS